MRKTARVLGERACIYNVQANSNTMHVFATSANDVCVLKGIYYYSHLYLQFGTIHVHIYDTETEKSLFTVGCRGARGQSVD